jgi:uncharacterized protein with NRDE domain
MPKAMKPIIKKVIVGVIIIATLGIGYGVYLWNKPHRDVTQEDAITVSAAQLVADFTTDEAKANAKYLNKTLEVQGVISNIATNQAGGTIVNIDGNNIMSAVYITLRANEIPPAIGTTVRIKGICTGFLSDVILVDAVIVK